MPEWRIYYSSGETFDSDQGKPEDAPSFGVQAVIVKDGRFDRRILRLADYYLWRPSLGRWTDHQDATSAIIAASREPWITLICGEYLREDDCEKILASAYNDPDFPPKKEAPKPHPVWKD